jgi:hypothetical protein
MPDRTGRPSAGECLDPEVLSAYVDGKLDVRERAAVEAHLASCADCYEVMSEVLHIQEAIPAARPASSTPEWGSADAAPDSSSTPPAWFAQAPRPSGDIVVRGAFGRRKAVWGVAGGLLAAAAALVLVVRLQPTWWTGGVDPKLADLVEAVGEERTVEARLTGGFKYGPLRSPMRSGGRVGPTDNWSLLAAAGRIREVAEKDPRPENLHALGIAHLVIGEYDEAIVGLERRAADDADARLQSDLAAALLARASAMGKAEDLPLALAAADRAIALDESLLEARFNRALALDRLQRRPQAEEAWEDYLRRDPSTAWSAEARGRLNALRKLLALRDHHAL